MRAAVFALLFGIASVLPLAGCNLLRPQAPAGETRVGQGKPYQSDNPNYDEFFEGVHEIQKETSDAGDQEAKARAPLERALGTRSATSERLVELTRERIKRGREGPPVHVVVSGLDAPKEGEPPKPVVAEVTVSDEAAVPPNQREIVIGLEQSAKSEAELTDKFGALSAKARRLLVRHGQLVASLNQNFTTSSRRQEVSNELGASKPILTQSADRAEKVAANGRAFLKGMAESFPKFGAPPPPKDEKAVAGPPQGKPKNDAAPKAAKPAAAPVSKPKHEPAVKAPPASEPAAPAPAPPPPPPPAAPPSQPKGGSEDFNP